LSNFSYSAPSTFFIESAAFRKPLVKRQTQNCELRTSGATLKLRLECLLPHSTRTSSVSVALA
jgi:hypothetical protein